MAEVLARAAKLPGRRERRRAEMREKIFRSAMRLFAKRGYVETTTEQITEAADVGQGTFFNYFPTKQDVLGVLAEIQLRKVRQARERAETQQGSIRELLRRLMCDIAKEPGRSQPLTRALFSAFLSSEKVGTFAGNILLEGRKDIAVIVGLGQKRGEILKSRSAADLALAYQRGLVGTLILWSLRPRCSLRPWIEKAFLDFWAGATAGKGSLK